MKSSILLLLNYHKWLGYLPFVHLKILAHARLIPRACLYGKSHWKPWHATGTKQAKLRQATAPGQVVSVDQLQLPTPGLIPQAKGTLTTHRYTGTTVFVGHYLDLTFVHLHESLSSAETVQAELAFEQFAAAHSIQIKHYHLIHMCH